MSTTTATAVISLVDDSAQYVRAIYEQNSLMLTLALVAACAALLWAIFKPYT